MTDEAAITELRAKTERLDFKAGIRVVGLSPTAARAILALLDLMAAPPSPPDRACGGSYAQDVPRMNFP